MEIKLQMLINGRRSLAEACWVHLRAIQMAEIGDRMTS
jgi:hypothetical protein